MTTDLESKPLTLELQQLLQEWDQYRSERIEKLLQNPEHPAPAAGYHARLRSRELTFCYYCNKPI